MAHDGCREVEWKGQAFSYLMHHPGFHKTENYGSAHKSSAAHDGERGSNAQHSSSSRDATGTWNGPAPTGARGQAAATAAATVKSVVVQEPATTLLSTGQRMPMIGLGTCGIKSPDVIKKALELGYRHFDCAAYYGNEAVIGSGLADFIAAGRRSELFIISKVWNTHHKPEDARTSVQQTLKDLGLQQLDLLLVHWPEAWLPGSELTGEVHPDTSVSLLDTWHGLEALVDEGLVAALGLSNCSLAQVEEVLAVAKHKPVCNQVELHPLCAQRKLVGVSYRKGVVSVAHTCLGGQLDGRELKSNPVVASVAAETGKTVAQVLLKYNMQRGVAVIPKATCEQHLAENITDMFNWRLSNQQKVLLDTLECGKRFIDFPWKNWGDVEDGGVAKPSRILATQQQ